MTSNNQDVNEIDYISIRPINDQEIFDQSQNILKNFWLKTKNGTSNSQNFQNPLELTLELIKSAKESILIYSPYISHGEIQIILEDCQKNSKIRIYAITQDIQIHKEFWKFGVMREDSKVDSTFIIIDHNKLISDNLRNKSKMIWFPGNLTKQNNCVPLILRPNSEQLKDFIQFFKLSFWKAQNKENFYGTIRNVKSIEPLIEKYEKLNNIFSIHNIEKLIETETVENLFIMEEHKDLAIYGNEAKNFGIQILDSMKEVDFDGFNGTTIFGTQEKLPFSFINTSHFGLLFTENLIIKISKPQAQEIVENTINFEWEFIESERYKNINSPFILFDEIWEKNQGNVLKPLLNKSLPSIETSDIDEWSSIFEKSHRKLPNYPSEELFFMKINYSWKILPPILPQHSKKHSLYNSWEKFEEKISNLVESEIEKINQILKNEDQYSKRKFFTKKPTLLKIIDIFSQTKEKSFGNMKKADIISDLDKIFELKKNISQILSDLTKKKMDDTNEKNKEEEITNELEILNKSKDSDMKKKSKKNSIKKTIDKDATYSLVNLIEQIPSSSLPEIGILYEYKNRNYLEISYIEQIKNAKEIIKNYPPGKIVVSIEG